MSNDIQVCVRGWVGNEPTLHVGPNGGVLARFRLGVTPRVRDRTTGEFRDGVTQWFTVKAWRDLAENACHSLHKGTPVVVRGLLSTETWSADGEERTSSVVTADAIGVDLGTGIAKFTRTIRRSAAADAGVPDATEGTAAGGAGVVTTAGDHWSVDAELPEDEPEEDDPHHTLVGVGAMSAPSAVSGD